MDNGNSIRFTFLGAAGMVTGSKTLVETDNLRLLVDYGAFQEETLDTVTLNRKLPSDPEHIDAVILTHGHLDHCGMLPYLVRKGYDGPIYGSAPTLDIARIIMADSARIQEYERKRAEKQQKQRRKPQREAVHTSRRSAFFFGEQDVADTYALLQAVTPDEWHDLPSGAKFRLRYNSHILGACFVELEIEGRTIVFSGDIGRSDDRIMHPPQKPDKGDVVVIEGTYGDRNHLVREAEPVFEKIVNETWEDKGTLLIPSFAVERTQVVMHILWTLKQQGKLPPMPVYIDSPMGISVLGLFLDYPEWHSMDKQVIKAMMDEFILVEDAKMSKRIVQDDEPKIVIAGSGMLTGGRILNYLKKYVRFPQTRILLVGYQGEETTGRALLEGEELISVDDKFFRVNATIHHLDFLSAHADKKAMLEWLGNIDPAPKRVFINHADPAVAPVFADYISQQTGAEVTVPKMRKPVTIQY